MTGPTARCAPLGRPSPGTDTRNHTAAQTTGSAEQPGPLSAEQQQQIALARKRARKIRRAAGVATFDAWTTGVFAAFTLSYALVSPVLGGFSWLALVVGAGMAAVAFNSFRGASRLRCYDVSAPRLLALNQLLFAAIIIAYCVWRVVYVLFVMDLNEKYPELAQLQADPTVAGVYGDIEELTRIVVPLAYGAVILGSILAQGGLALYYLTRARHVREFRRQTPQWITDLLTAAAG